MKVVINAEDYPNPERATPKLALDRGQPGLIEALLLPGELVCWAGCEPRSRIFRKRFGRITAYSVWTGALGLYSLSMILLNPSFLRHSLPGMLPILAPVGLVLLGAYLLGSEIVHLFKARPEVYAITNHRALVISPGRVARVQEYGPGVSKTAQVRRRKGGGGDILFERRVEWGKDAQGRSTRKTGAIGFFGVKCLEEVMEKLEQMG